MPLVVSRRRGGHRLAHHEIHRSGRATWLRASVLGANDGLLSTASLSLGVAAASPQRSVILTAALGSLVAGSLSMAVGEYSSVSSQRDTEVADLDRERHELVTTPDAEEAELAAIYRARGLSHGLARQVAAELSAGDALRHHARDELGLDPDRLAAPTQAAGASALSFAVGSLLPVLVILWAPAHLRAFVTVVTTIVLLGVLGYTGARLGGAPKTRAAVRVIVGSSAALAVSTLVGHVVGGVV